MEVNVSFCIKTGVKAYTIYKQKAVNEISKENVFLIKLPKNDLEKTQNEKQELDNNNNNINKELYWYFLACFTNTEHLRNYVN